LILKYFQNEELSKLNDAAVLECQGESIIFSTDSFVVDPLFFPGGDIGKLAVCGTVNDLAVMGARPLFMSVGFILEEGFPFSDLEKILGSMREMSEEAHIQIVTGDTKVVPRGVADKIFINTTGVGVPLRGSLPSGQNAKPGDKIIINGYLADHGITVMAKREGLGLDFDLETDSAPLNKMIIDLLETITEIHVLRDPTRGGVATTLNEIARQSDVGIKIYEESLPVSPNVNAICEILGLDPLYIANEGKVLVFTPSECADKVLSVMQKNIYGEHSRVIGEVVDEPKSRVYMETLIGGKRMIEMLAGEQLPRIC
jgi:hydrogenase expression/formation protein HypE